jgi:hypothetical protein
VVFNAAGECQSRSSRWNDWNIDHATRHGVTIKEMERIILAGPARFVGDGKYSVVGRGVGGRWIQVIYLISPAECYYPIHARELTDAEKRRQRRRR